MGFWRSIGMFGDSYDIFRDPCGIAFGFFWVSGDRLGYLGILMAFLWIVVGFYWVPGDRSGFLGSFGEAFWILLGSWQSIRIFWDIFMTFLWIVVGLLWDSFWFPAIVWDLWDPYGPLFGFSLNSFGFLTLDWDF